MIKLTCPTCGEVLSISEKSAGATRTCNKCRNAITVPPLAQPASAQRPGGGQPAQKRGIKETHKAVLITVGLIFGSFLLTSLLGLIEEEEDDATVTAQIGPEPELEPDAKPEPKPEPEPEPEPEPDTKPEPKPEPVNLTLSARLTGASSGSEVLRISGSANTLDTAVIHYEVKHQDDVWSFDSGDAIVDDGRYRAHDVDVSDWPRGEIEIWVGFRPWFPSQPESAQEKYGEKGQHISDSSRVTIGELTRLEVRETLTKRSGPPPPEPPVTYNDWQREIDKARVQEERKRIREKYHIITREDFESIEVGDSREWVVDVLGSDGTKTQTASFGGRRIEIFEWRNPHPFQCGVRIRFEDSRVSSKEQIGRLE